MVVELNVEFVIEDFLVPRDDTAVEFPETRLVLVPIEGLVIEPLRGASREDVELRAEGENIGIGERERDEEDSLAGLGPGLSPPLEELSLGARGFAESFVLGLPKPMEGLRETWVVAGALVAGTSFGGGGGGAGAGVGGGGALLVPAPKFHTFRTRVLADERNPKRDVLLFPITGRKNQLENLSRAKFSPGVFPLMLALARLLLRRAFCASSLRFIVSLSFSFRLSSFSRSASA